MPAKPRPYQAILFPQFNWLAASTVRGLRPLEVVSVVQRLVIVKDHVNVESRKTQLLGVP